MANLNIAISLEKCETLSWIKFLSIFAHILDIVIPLLGVGRNEEIREAAAGFSGCC